MKNKLQKAKIKRKKISTNLTSSSLNLRKNLWYIFRWFLIRLSFLFLATVLTTIIYFYLIIPSFESILDGRQQGSVTFLDKNGETFAWRGQQFDNSLRSTNASPFLLNAVISSEDKNFFRHFGISIRGILGAIQINLREGRGPFEGHGGSTITQQVAKLLCFMNNTKIESQCRRQSLARKILEIPFSIALELKFSKPEILSIYMNRVYLGASAIGFEAASQRYFDKSATQVSLAESAMLTALLKAPSKYAPTHNLALAQKRAQLVITSMLKQKYISEAQASFAISNPATLSKNAKMTIGAHFVDWVMLDAPKVLTTKTTEDVIISTTFDPIIQKHVEKTVLEVFASNVRPDSEAEVAVVVMSKKGNVVAMLGGRKNTQISGQYNRAFQAYRQPGSAFKPFVYATALQQGYAPDYLLDDTRIPPQNISDMKYWPRNYNKEYLGKISLSYGLTHSVNTVTVQLAHLVGLKQIIKLAKDLGIRSNLSSNLSLALGSSEVSLLNLTTAYTGLLNLGYRVYPRGWFDLKLKSNNEVLIKSSVQEQEKVLSRSASKALIAMLVSTIETGTGKQASINDWHLAGKTGTSQDARDAWFIGFSSKYVVGVWMGSDDNTPLKGVVGGNLPSDIWSKIMQKIHYTAPDRLPTYSTEEYLKSLSVKSEGKTKLFPEHHQLDEKDNALVRFLDYLKKLTQ